MASLSPSKARRVLKFKSTSKPFVSYSAEGNMFIYAGQKTPKFCSHGQFLGGVRSLKSGQQLKNDIAADRKLMKSIYKANNPYVPSYLKPSSTS